MNYTFFDLLTLIGSLGMFLYGMKMMSEALQKLAGSKLRSILSFMTTNRFLGILTGIIITILVQSSSATTVMVVSFVNAGLMSLVQSIGVIMGANVGTTVTGWLISFLAEVGVGNVSYSVSDISLPLMGLALFFIFSKLSRRKYFGELLLGFALLFLGLDFLKDSVPDIKSNPEILHFVEGFTDWGFASTLLFLLIGTLLTVVLQSSSATMSLTILMCGDGLIPFDMAVAMVLGENIGTTITANMAAMMGNTAAKRAARAHFIFNVFGVTWALIALPLLIKFVRWAMDIPIENAEESDLRYGLALFHTMFNITNVVLLVGFIPFIKRVVVRITPRRVTDEDFSLKYIRTGLLDTPEMSVVQTRRELDVYVDRVCKMFSLVKTLSTATSERDFAKLFAKIKKNEEIADRLEEEIAHYVSELSVHNLRTETTNEIRGILKSVSELESMADSCFSMAQIYARKREGKIEFNEDINANVAIMFGYVDEVLAVLKSNVSSQNNHFSLAKARNIEHKINSFRDELRKNHVDHIKSKKYRYKEGIIYIDLIRACEHVGDHALNISEALALDE